MSIQEKIQNIVDANRVVLFMKGSVDFPQCGFSGKVAQILKLCGAEYKDVNILEDPEIRQGIKDFSDWPTIPQLYIGGEFIGGSDIVTQLYESGDLQKQLDPAS